jgi:hypothetical protein
VLGEPATGANYIVKYDYNIAANHRMLGGTIDAFVRAKLLFLKKTWKKTLTHWEGIKVPIEIKALSAKPAHVVSDAKSTYQPASPCLQPSLDCSLGEYESEINLEPENPGDEDLTLLYSVNGEDDQVIFFSAEYFLDRSRASAGEVANAINDQASDIVAYHTGGLYDAFSSFSNENGHVVVETAKKGSAATIEIKGGTAQSRLEFPSGVFVGRNDLTSASETLSLADQKICPPGTDSSGGGDCIAIPGGGAGIESYLGAAIPTYGPRSQLFLGEQRNMVVLPSLDGIFDGEGGDILKGLQLLGPQIGLSFVLQGLLTDDERWEEQHGLCEPKCIPVP